MPDNFDEWIRVISYIIGAIGGAVVFKGLWGMSQAYWDLYEQKENDERRGQ